MSTLYDGEWSDKADAVNSRWGKLTVNKSPEGMTLVMVKGSRYWRTIAEHSVDNVWVLYMGLVLRSANGIDSRAEIAVERINQV